MALKDRRPAGDLTLPGGWVDGVVEGVVDVFDRW